jgi:subtilisin family serine protease
MRKLWMLVAVAAAGSLTVLTGTGSAGPDRARDYVVLYQQGSDAAQARAAIRQAGGRVTSENTAVGLATVSSDRADFAEQVTKADAVEGAAADRSIGKAPGDRAKRRDVEKLQAERRAHRGDLASPAPSSAADPLSGLQWDMRRIKATADGSYAVNQGSSAVRVGIVDTGVDGSHPDIAPNFDRDLSRNFTTDDPIIDGACEDEPDGSCSDPADVDEDGHGTHVAGTIGAPLNGIGIAGVAPRTTLVNLRAGQDSGYFFLQPVVDALTYAGDHGIDVVNMSFYIDPWLYNCAGNAADTPEQQQEQRTIVAATQRALDYARARGVTLVSALGNEHTDLGRPAFDDTSPDYPPDAAHDRTVDNSCLSMPTEGNGVIGVGSVGPSGQKAYYSNYGTEQADVSAPGGDYRDGYGTPTYKDPQANLILAPYPESLARANGDVDEAGAPTTPFVVRDCQQGRCAYYQELQGTSMAAPHAAGVAALIVAARGKRDTANGGLTLDPAKTQQVLERTAQDTACPEPRLYHHPSPDLGAEYDAYCEGSPKRNGFFGDGLIDALAAGH